MWDPESSQQRHLHSTVCRDQGTLHMPVLGCRGPGQALLAGSHGSHAATEGCGLENSESLLATGGCRAKPGPTHLAGSSWLL